MRNKTSILAALLITGSTSLSAETETFGTGEVDATVLSIGDHVEVSYRGRNARGRASIEEAVGTVVRVNDELLEVDTAQSVVTLFYKTIIRLDRTRETFRSLDAEDILLSEAELVAKYLANNELTGMEGVWVWDDRSFEIVVIKDESDRIKRFDYIGLILSSTLPSWKLGEIKLLLKQTATEEAYSAVVVTSEKKNYNTTVLVRKNRLIEGLLPREPDGGQIERHQILRTYPLPKEPETRVATSESKLVRHGSGFFISSDIIATANHLVEEANTIVARLNGHAIEVSVKGRDKRNNIALLSIDASSQDVLKGLTVVPLILGDSGETSEGDRVVTSGFTSHNAVRPSVSEGIVNSLSGAKEDLTRFTISSADRPGVIGGPLIDSSNRVIGIVLPPDSTDSGAIHVAVKADLLSALLRMASIRAASPDTSDATSKIDTSLIGQMARSAVVSIEAK